MICDNEFLVNFDEKLKEEERVLKEQIILLEDTVKAFDSVNLGAQTIIEKSFDVEKVFLIYLSFLNKETSN